MQDFLQKHRKKFLAGGPLVVLIIILFYYLLGGRYQSTDDAYLNAANVSISSNVSGRVQEIYVHDNQMVKKGERLFLLDERPYRIRVAAAKAKLKETQLQIEELKALYLLKQAEVKSAQSTLAFETKELARQKKLAASGISSQTLLSKTNNDFNKAFQSFIAAQQSKMRTLAALSNNPHIRTSDHPLVQQAQAELNKAQLNLSYTVIYAPMDGIVTKVEQLQVGDYITTGTPVFALISTHDLWITANFKETQITHMRPNQPVVIKIDAYSDKKFTGKVVSLTPGTGSTFSLLPPENATGNWVKIVQRVPVRIAITDWNDYPKDSVLVLSGLSAYVTVDTQPPLPSTPPGNS